jgi:S-formylglutathione hydrolase FrmB
MGILLVAGCTPAPDAAAPVVVPGPSRSEATIERSSRLDDRLIELVVDSPSVGRTPVRILLPRHFDAEPDRRWPVLYLFHGGGGSYVDWTRASDVEAMTEDLDLMVVMPDSGPGATFVDWAYPGPDSQPQYETYHVDELPALLRERFRANGRAAVAGVSAGAFGAMSYAARHPDLYAAVASFSGNLDTRDDDQVGPVLSAIVTFALERTFPLGDPFTEEVRWRGHNPLDLAPNLAGTDVFVSGGNGQYGVLDPPLTPPDWLTLESSTERRSRRFVDRMQALGLPVTTDFYGNGMHSYRYWNRELGRALPLLTAAVADDRTPPSEFTYRSTERRFSVWGWTFQIEDRALPAFTDVKVDGDTIATTGNGTLVVTTPPRFTPGGSYTVGGRNVRADDDGRVRFSLAMGSTAEAYTAAPDLPGPRPTGPPVTAAIIG